MRKIDTADNGIKIDLNVLVIRTCLKIYLAADSDLINRTGCLVDKYYENVKIPTVYMYMYEIPRNTQKGAV